MKFACATKSAVTQDQRITRIAFILMHKRKIEIMLHAFKPHTMSIELQIVTEQCRYVYDHSGASR